jgi:hypothetical protein
VVAATVAAPAKASAAARGPPKSKPHLARLVEELEKPTASAGCEAEAEEELWTAKKRPRRD